MSDLKTITFLLSFIVLFGAVAALVYSEESNLTTYETGNISYTEPSLNPFNAVKDTIPNISTGSWFIDEIVLTIFGGIVVFLIYRAVRGQ